MGQTTRLIATVTGAGSRTRPAQSLQLNGVSVDFIITSPGGDTDRVPGIAGVVQLQPLYRLLKLNQSKPPYCLVVFLLLLLRRARALPDRPLRSQTRLTGHTVKTRGSRGARASRLALPATVVSVLCW